MRIETLLVPQIKTLITTIGAEPDHALISQLKGMKRQSNHTAYLIDIHQTPSLDIWEDLIWGNFPNTVLLRPETQTPTTPIIHLTPAAVSATLAPYGQWLKTTKPSYGFTFSPGWKFPDWILARLELPYKEAQNQYHRARYQLHKLIHDEPEVDPRTFRSLIHDILAATKKLRSRTRVWHFADLSAIGLDALLMEYAGLIQRGFEFSLKEASPIQENIRAYLRHRYGGQAGLNKQIELWLDAHDAQYQESLTINANGRYQSFDGSIRPRSNREIPRQADPQTADEILRDAVFMGSCDDPAAANSSIRRATFLVNGKKLRKYHEGRNTLRAKRLIVDDDPSDGFVCEHARTKGELRRAADQRRSKRQRSPLDESGPFTAPPEGTVFCEETDWVPGPEHLEAFKAHLTRNGTPFQQEPIDSGYWRYYPSEQGIRFLFVPLKEWSRRWNPETKTMEPGKGDRLSPAEKKLWNYASGGTQLCFHDAQGNEVVLFFKKNERPDSFLPYHDSRAKLLREQKGRGELSERALQKIARPRQTKEGIQWELPRSFTTHDGRTVHLGPRPPFFSRTDWSIWKRSWISLNTVRKHLTEERWERLAFNPTTPVGEHFENETDLYQDSHSLEQEATLRINDYLDELLARIQATQLDPDIKENFAQEIADVKSLIEPSIQGTLGLPRGQLTLADMNPPVAMPQARPQPQTHFDRVITDGFRKVFAAANHTVKKGGPAADKVQEIRDRILRKFRPDLVEQPKITQPVVYHQVEQPAAKHQSDKIAWALYLIQTPETPDKKKQAAKQWLQRHDRAQARGIEFKYRGPGRLIAGCAK